MVIDRFDKLEVQEGVGCSGSPNRGDEVQSEVDLAMGTIFCGKLSKGLLLVRQLATNFGLDNLCVRYHFE